MTEKKQDITTIVFDPQTASSLAVNLVADLRKDAAGGIKSGIGDLDKMLLPFRSGELVTVLGYTSNYKSGFMNWLSKQGCKKKLSEIRAKMNL